MELRGPTLTLQLPAPAHAPGLLAAGSDPEVTRHFSWGPYREPDEPLRWIAAQEGRREAGVQLDLVVVRDGEARGVIGLSELSRRDRRATVGTWLARELWGTGANREAKALLFALAFEHLGLQRLTAYADVRHGRSQRALEGIGFVREGVLRHFHLHAGEPKSVVVFGLLEAEWRSGPLRSIGAELAGRLPPAWLTAG